MINVDSIKDPNFKRFMSHVIRECIKNKIQFRTSCDNEINDGEFDDELRFLEVSEKDHFLNILVHEYSHMKQWIEGLAIWRTKYKGYEPYDVVHNWLHEGKEYPEDVLDKCFRLVKEVELDCEKRAVETINKWKLPIDTKTYTKCAIAYLYYFDYMRHYRKVGCSYESPKILKLIKPDFSKYNLDVRNQKIETLMNEETKN